jgi:hypothetical protein
LAAFIYIFQTKFLPSVARSEQAFVSLLNLSMAFFMKETGKYEIVKEFTSNEKKMLFCFSENDIF